MLRIIPFALLISLFATTILAQQTILPVSTPEFIEYSPTLSPDGKSLIFQSNKEGVSGLYECTLNPDGKWSAAKPVSELNNWSKPQRIIGGPCYSPDGNQLYFCALTSSGNGEMDLYVSIKKNNQWSSPENLGSKINTVNSETFPSISADNKKLFFSRTLLGDTSRCPKLMVSEKDENGNWKDATEVTSTQSCGKTPRIMYDQNYMLLSGNNTGNFDLMQFKLSEGQYQNPKLMSFANTTSNETGAAVSKREDMLIYASNGDIFYSFIPNEFRMHGKVWEGQTIDKETKKTIATRIWVIDTLARDTVYSYNTDSEGKFSINLPAFPGLKVLVRADKFIPFVQSFAISEVENFELLKRNIEMRPTKKEVVFRVSDADNNKSLKVKIKVTNIETKEESIIDTEGSRDGQYAINLREGNKYNIEISSIEGYAFVNQTIDLNTMSENYVPSSDTAKPKTETMPVEIKLQPLKDNTKLELKDIYFESNSSSLSDSSFAELSRVIKLMKANSSAKIEIAAHTDDKGSDEYNHTLSQKRAQEIVKYLASQGISSSRLVAVGYGKTKPKVANTSDEARAQNRRVEMKILDIK
jgi:outer membrane protein OmpA-like peptidoglycan-associated protein